MNNTKTIVIFSDRPIGEMQMAVDHYALRWKDAGYRVIKHVGLNNFPNADVVIVCISSTVVPLEYVDIINKFSGVVINGKALDTSRRRFSRLMLSKSDNYKGPVIVKTDANYGGLSEFYISSLKRLSERSVYGSIKRFFRSSFIYLILRKSALFPIIKRIKERKSTPKWDTIQSLNPLKYPIFKNIESVPQGVWENDNLIVERFINNSDGDLFHVHYCEFFGDKILAGRLASHNPIVKFGNAVSEEETPIPDVVMKWRKDLNIDFGRFDYIEAEGEYFLIDVNRVEGGGDISYNYPDEMDFLASGLEYYLDRKSKESFEIKDDKKATLLKS